MSISSPGDYRSGILATVLLGTVFSLPGCKSDAPTGTQQAETISAEQIVEMINGYRENANTVLGVTRFNDLFVADKSLCEIGVPNAALLHEGADYMHVRFGHACPEATSLPTPWVGYIDAMKPTGQTVYTTDTPADYNRLKAAYASARKRP